MSSTETQMKNSAILKAGKTKPTIGTRIEGKNAAAILCYILKSLINSYQLGKLIIFIIYKKLL